MNIYLNSTFNKIRIYDTTYNNDLIRVMEVNGCPQSACFVDDDKRTELVIDYTKYFNIIFNVSNCKEILMLGGGGYSYPKYLISHYNDILVDVVEIDNEIKECALKYMFLQDFIEKYDSSRINLITDNGLKYIRSCEKTYDAIINDAYNGNELIKDFLNVDFLHSLKSKLRSDGIYITNILSSLEGENSYILKNGVNSLKEVFNNVFVFPCSNSSNVNSINNNIVLATDKSINIEDFNLDTKDVKKFN